MITITVDQKGLNKKLDRMLLRIRQDAVLAMMEGFMAVINATPEDSGFLRASWHVAIDGRRSRDPGDPDYERKLAHDAARPFRSLPAGAPKGVGRDTFVGGSSWVPEAPGPKPDPAFAAHYGDVREHFRLIRRRTLRQPFARQFSFSNNAPYGDVVEAHTPFKDRAAILARNAVIRRLRATSRRERVA